MQDKYDVAVEFLTANPDEINRAWMNVGDAEGSCLFGFANSDPLCATDNIGCLTAIRSGFDEAKTADLTARIRADKRLPLDSSDITVASLPVFAEWQRILDKELNRAIT